MTCIWCMSEDLMSDNDSDDSNNSHWSEDIPADLGLSSLEPSSSTDGESSDSSIDLHSLTSDLQPLAKSFKTMVHGGPLFLKPLLDQLTANTENALHSFPELVKTCEIKGDDANKSENIDKVVEEFCGIIEAIFALREGQAPEDLVLNLLRIFQSTGVPTFNNHFKLFEEDHCRSSVHRSIDPDHKSDGPVTTNDKKAAHHKLTFAEKAH